MNKFFIKIYSISITLRRRFFFTVKRPFVKLGVKFLLKKLHYKSKIIFVYDLNVSPSTYGDYIQILLIARFFLFLNKEVHLILVKDQLRLDSYNSKTNSIYPIKIKILNELKELSYFFCKVLKGKFIYEELSWLETYKYIKDTKNLKSVFIYKEKKVLERLPFYKTNFETLVHLSALLSPDRLKNYLLNIEQFKHFNFPKEISSKPYIAFNVRMNTSRSQSNTSNQIFEDVIKQLQTNYPSHQVLVVSDDVGCEYFSDLAATKSIECLFSKKIIPNGKFFDDALLVLGADYYVQINGGGISIIREFCQRPYFINHSLIFMQYSFKKVYNFQSRNQIYITRKIKDGIKIPIYKSFK
tara:strand:+ start:833 stop:1897 length:1065 start_codon:yes stop_codon:yes gene_type:complete